MLVKQNMFWSYLENLLKDKKIIAKNKIAYCGVHSTCKSKNMKVQEMREEIQVHYCSGMNYIGSIFFETWLW